MTAPLSAEDEFWQAHYADTRPALQVRLNLPYERPPEPLTANWRGHWSRRHAATANVRAVVTALARQAGLHRYAPGQVEHVSIQLVWAPGDRRRRDSDNLWPMLKVGADAIARGPRRDLVGIDLVPDDDPAHMTKHAPVILPPPAPKGMWIDLRLALASPQNDERTPDDLRP